MIVMSYMLCKLIRLPQNWSMRFSMLKHPFQLAPIATTHAHIGPETSVSYGTRSFRKYQFSVVIPDYSLSRPYKYEIISFMQECGLKQDGNFFYDPYYLVRTVYHRLLTTSCTLNPLSQGRIPYPRDINTWGKTTI